MDFNQILTNLYCGSCPKTADDVKTLRDHGITGVVNLQSDSDFAYHGIDWSALRAAYFACKIDARRAGGPKPTILNCVGNWPMRCESSVS